ncbi:cyclic lactone autoinducer peptide [Paenibacillus sp. IB182496]|uniref:Cyclic lactone autoinducer peptide n=1 Tax=Paenibacillus sabuli TaxID=2772509 RepID=A0A927BRN1_9BACL|nr:cyclic lactone autoinducer peptide [Paenibacillus sabuli]MBD2845032.1 cyclic lactone autoinducer peptide [Paenibacillus sabuli]
MSKWLARSASVCLGSIAILFANIAKPWAHSPKAPEELLKKPQ